MNENTVWTDSQDYGSDEILCISKKRYFTKPPDSQAKLSLFSGSHPNYFKSLTYPAKTAPKTPLFCHPFTNRHPKTQPEIA